MLLHTALMCLALNVYHEARGEIIPGQYAVALTTVNRANSEHKPICDVVTAHKQFSWTIKLLHKTHDGYELRPAGVPKEPDAWHVAIIISKNVLAGKMSDFTNGSMFYHARRVNPYWSASMVETKAIGSHIFYRMH